MLVRMNERHGGFAERLVAAILETAGHTASALRRQVFELSAAFAGSGRGAPPAVPRELAHYVEKVARHAYRVTDQDVQALRRVGFSEEAIFELTLSAALAAATFRLERGLSALRGDPR
jgi:alkylhydroperoxidase family enzyme